MNVQWEWNYQPRAGKWSLSERKGFLRLYATKPIKPEDFRRIMLRATNTITQRSMRNSSSVVTLKMDVSHLVNEQYAGLTHFSTESISTIGVKMENGQRHLSFETANRSGNNETGKSINFNGKCVWLRSNWDLQGQNSYFYSLDGKTFESYGEKTQLMWGSYRGDRIGIFNYNTLEDAGFVDVDWFNYQ